MEILGSLLEGYTPILLFILICFAALLVMFYRVVRSLDDVIRAVSQDRDALQDSVLQIRDQVGLLIQHQADANAALQKIVVGGVRQATPVSAYEEETYPPGQAVQVEAPQHGGAYTSAVAGGAALGVAAGVAAQHDFETPSFVEEDYESVVEEPEFDEYAPLSGLEMDDVFPPPEPPEEPSVSEPSAEVSTADDEDIDIDFSLDDVIVTGKEAPEPGVDDFDVEEDVPEIEPVSLQEEEVAVSDDFLMSPEMEEEQASVAEPVAAPAAGEEEPELEFALDDLDLVSVESQTLTESEIDELELSLTSDDESIETEVRDEGAPAPLREAESGASVADEEDVLLLDAPFDAGQIVSEAPSSAGKERFEPGVTDEFSLTSEELADIEELATPVEAAEVEQEETAADFLLSDDDELREEPQSRMGGVDKDLFADSMGIVPEMPETPEIEEGRDFHFSNTEGEGIPLEAMDAGMDETMIEAMKRDVNLDVALAEDEEEIHFDTSEDTGGWADKDDLGDISIGADREEAASRFSADEEDEEPQEQHVDFAKIDEEDQDLDLLIENLSEVDMDLALDEETHPDDEAPDFETELVLEEDDEPETELDLGRFQRPERSAPPQVISMDDEDDFSLDDLGVMLEQDTGDTSPMSGQPVAGQEDRIAPAAHIEAEDEGGLELLLDDADEDVDDIMSETMSGPKSRSVGKDAGGTAGASSVVDDDGLEALNLDGFDLSLDLGDGQDSSQGGSTGKDAELDAFLSLGDDDLDITIDYPKKRGTKSTDDDDIVFIVEEDDEP